jgi:hypothetical protein
VRIRHKAFADQKRPITACRQMIELLARLQAALAHGDDVFAEARGETL